MLEINPMPQPCFAIKSHREGTLSLHTCMRSSGLSLCPAELRGTAESFIRASYRASFQANPSQLLPHMLVSLDQQQRVDMALGMKPADEGPLFLEQYLDVPIENAITARMGYPVARHAIVEIGNLAVTRPGAIRNAIAHCTHWLFEEGYEWVAFTGTRTLRHSFARLGLAPVTLAPASPERLPAANRSRWGTYFDHQPELCIGHIAEGRRALP